jgi:hypothetical protein
MARCRSRFPSDAGFGKVRASSSVSFTIWPWTRSAPRWNSATTRRYAVGRCVENSKNSVTSDQVYGKRPSRDRVAAGHGPSEEAPLERGMEATSKEFVEVEESTAVYEKA